MSGKPVQVVFDSDARIFGASHVTCGYMPGFFLLRCSFMEDTGASIFCSKLPDVLVVPHLAKKLLQELETKIAEYEAQYGKIEEPKASGLYLPDRNISKLD